MGALAKSIFITLFTFNFINHSRGNEDSSKTTPRQFASCPSTIATGNRSLTINLPPYRPFVAGLRRRLVRLNPPNLQPIFRYDQADESNLEKLDPILHNGNIQKSIDDIDASISRSKSIRRRRPWRWLKNISPVRWGFRRFGTRSELRRRKPQSVLPIPNKRYRMYFACFAIVFTWVALGTLFYSFYNQWPIPQSFFYAVDAGMSIGFCTDVAETKIASRAFTVVYILLGASCVGGALVLMVQNILEGAASRSSALYKQSLERDSFKKLFFAEKSGSVGNKKTGTLSYQLFYRVLRRNGCALTREEFQKVCRFYDPKKNGFISYEDFDRLFRGTDRILPSSPYMYCKSPLLRNLAQLWDTLSSLFTNEDRRIYLIFILWIGMGVAWGILDQKWDPITATHFAVSALATGGLTAPPVDSNGILPARAAIFCGLYCLFGIPLFALTLSQFARVLVEGYIVEEEHMAITRPLTRAEFQFASKSLCSTDDVIHLSDFIVLQLFRQGKLSVESLEFMKRQFQLLDKSNSGRLSWDETILSELSDHKKWNGFHWK